MSEKPAVGARVMFPYGRREYIDYGEVGTITSHEEGRRFTFTRDDYQPFAKWMFGSKAKLTGHAKERNSFTAHELKSLAEVYAGNAARFRSVAEAWDQNAEHEVSRAAAYRREGVDHRTTPVSYTGAHGQHDAGRADNGHRPAMP